MFIASSQVSLIDAPALAAHEPAPLRAFISVRRHVHVALQLDLKLNAIMLTSRTCSCYHKQ